MNLNGLFESHVSEDWNEMVVVAFFHNPTEIYAILKIDDEILRGSSFSVLGLTGSNNLTPYMSI